MKVGKAAILLISIAFMLLITPFIILFYDSFSAKVEINEDLTKYETAFIDVDDNSKYRSKWGMDESIWPDSIAGLNVLEYRMIYYNPWDSQWVGYLKIAYKQEDYEKEIERLKSLGKTKYVGYYGVSDEMDEKIIAMNADEYQGFIYAIDAGDNTIMYAEQIFCNYQLDFDYEKYVPNEYLLPGFNASPNNPYQKSH